MIGDHIYVFRVKAIKEEQAEWKEWVRKDEAAHISCDICLSIYKIVFLEKGIKNAKIQKILKVSAVHVRIGFMEEDIDGEYCKAGIADDFQY